MGEHEMVPAGRIDLATQSELFEPMLYYGVKPRISIEYISDIHLLHHARYFDNNVRKTVNALAKSLSDSHRALRSNMPLADRAQLLWDMQVFLGDISSTAALTVEFYRRYRLNAVYDQYKRFRRKQAMTANHVSTFEHKRVNAIRRRDAIEKYIAVISAEFKQLKSQIDKYVSYNKVIAPKGDLEDVERYLDSNYYKKRNLPASLKDRILAASALAEKMSDLGRRKQKLDSWLTTEVAPSEIKLTDFTYHLNSPVGLVVLGNHEYIDFTNVDEAVRYYKTELEPLGFVVLQNEYIERSDIVIYGGSGFAKYNETYNANNLVCCKAMEGNRAYEIEQTTLFENGYEDAKRHAIETGKCFICLSHYPVESCLGKFDRETVYFTGHTHMNARTRTEEKILYADNQVGYHKKGGFSGKISFKKATTDSVTNPYDSLEDGCYQTRPEEYLRFCDYIGEYVGEGKLIRKRCEAGKLYVIKSQGYYGFFIANKSGLSIVNGGKTQRIALNKNIGWIYDNFSIVVNKYLAALEPLRMVQNQLSRELRRLGFTGTIHGLIVDIDYYNHIMVNPLSGSITFYYSRTFGFVKEFESFQKQLEFMSDIGLLNANAINPKIDALLHEGEKSTIGCDALALRGSNMLISAENGAISDEMMEVSRRDGAYGVSRVINPLQRLFTGHVLRSFDLRLIGVEDENTTVNRRRSTRGRVYRNYISGKEFLIVHDDLGEFVTLLDTEGNKSVASILELKKTINGGVYAKGRWVTKSPEETLERYKGKRRLPDSWLNEILRMQPGYPVEPTKPRLRMKS
ncbi:hypothetical protein [Parolsenella catena]|uniref:hypothetical protein n=1 Tax=Parolsenella catena TaxID=2003188 RepID=UPI002E77B0ED|nr:hypothetical protein [Parolsenella catena]